METHFEPLEASFQAAYGLDLRQALWGPRRIGVRRLAALIGGLPTASPFARSVNPAAAWGPVEEFTATTVEMLDALLRQLWPMTMKGRPPGDPVRIERPIPAAGHEEEQIEVRSKDDLIRELEKRGRLWKEGEGRRRHAEIMGKEGESDGG